MILELLAAYLVFCHGQRSYLVASFWESAATGFLLPLTERHHGSEYSHSLLVLCYLDSILLSDVL